MKKIKVFDRMKVWLVRYESNPKEAKKLDTLNYSIFHMVYVDPTGCLTEENVRARVARAQGIGKRWVYMCRSMDRALPAHAFRVDN